VRLLAMAVMMACSPAHHGHPSSAALTTSSTPASDELVPSGPCAGLRVEARSDTSSVALRPGRDASIDVRVGESVAFANTGPCSAQVSTTSDSETLSSQGSDHYRGAMVGAGSIVVSLPSCAPSGAYAGCVGGVLLLGRIAVTVGAG